MTDDSRPRTTLRVSGKRMLLTLGVLALLVAAALYWSLFPLYSRGKEGLRTPPPAHAESPEAPAP